MLTKDSRGKVVGRSGLIFEILDQISYKVLTNYRRRHSLVSSLLQLVPQIG